MKAHNSRMARQANDELYPKDVGHHVKNIRDLVHQLPPEDFSSIINEA